MMLKEINTIQAIMKARGCLPSYCNNERIVIGSELAPEYVTETETVDHTTTVVTTQTSGASGGTIPSFTVVFVMVGLLVAIPIIAKKRK